MIIEKRHHPRIDISIEAEIRYRGRSFSAIVRNLSSCGLFLETSPLRIPRGNMVDIRFRFHGRDWMLLGLIVEQIENRGLCIMFREQQPVLFEQARKPPPQMIPYPNPLPQHGFSLLESTS